jgi:hypothetical protein
LIATDPLSLVFIFCFLLGFGFFIVSALMGGHTHSHAVSHAVAHAPAPLAHVAHAPVQPPHAVGHQAGQQANQANASAGRFSLLSAINPMSIAIFLFGFGLFGYFFHNLTNLIFSLTLVLAIVSGLILAVLLLLAINRIFIGSEGSTEQDVADRTGMLGKVSITIPEQGIGEIIYTSPGGMYKSVPARGLNKQHMERDQEVVVVNYEDGVAEVDTWEHFMHEGTDLLSGPDESDLNELARLPALSNEPDIFETKNNT